MCAIEIGDDIIVIDAGFEFSNEDAPGVDYVLPNTGYLEERKDKIRGLVITHGHLDHIGGIPYVMPRIGNPPIYCRSFTEYMIKKRQEEFPHQEPLDIRVVETEDTLKLGDQTVRFFGITHTIPDSMGIIVDTPYGQIVNQADFKLDHEDGVVSQEEEEEYSRVAEKDTLVLMADSTNIENAGFSTPEWRVHEDLEKIVRDINGRIILGSFASQIERLVAVVKFAEKYDRKVVLEGRSLRTNLGVAKEAGLFVPGPKTVISAEESKSLPENRVLILATGSQGEEYAALNRMANKTHKVLSLTPDDTVVLSASIVPGNEVSVAKLKDNIARTGAQIISYRNSELYVHGSGHGNRQELLWLHKKLQPKFFVPQHGSHYMLKAHANMAIHENDMDPDNVVVPENGSIIEITEGGTKIDKLKHKAPSNILGVDGFSIGNVQDVVIRDRELLAEDGIFVVIVTLDPKTGKLHKSPDIISRGFVYLRQEKDLLNKARGVIRKIVRDHAKKNKPLNFNNLKRDITKTTRKFLLKRTAKRPLVIPVVLGV